MGSSEVLTPEIFNLTLTNANTEYSQQLSVGTKYFSAQCRTAFDVRYAFVTGKVATPTAPWGTIKSGMWYNSPEKLGWAEDLVVHPRPIYCGSGQAGVVVEIICWKET